MKIEKFDTFDDFYLYITSGEYKLNEFPLVEEQLSTKECYQDDEWITWYICKDQDDEVIGIIATRKKPDLPNSIHITTLEVANYLRYQGYGSKMLKLFLKAFDVDFVTLYAEEKNWTFYNKLGFKNSDDNPLYMIKEL